MKKTVFCVLVLSLSLAVFCPAFAETDAAQTPKAETPAAEKTAEELYQTGVDANNAGDYGKALEYFQLAADAGHPEAWRSIGAMYANGDGVEMDLDKAREYFQLSMELGDARAFNNMGTLYLYGMGVEQDTGKAVEYYQKAGDLGFVDAYIMLALYDLFNIGLNEGHSMYFGLNAFALKDFPYPEITKTIADRANSMLQLKSYALTQIITKAVETRKPAWGDDVYRECGSTAIIRINEFNPDTAGWEAYYAGTGEIPMDAVGITWTGLKKASENQSHGDASAVQRLCNCFI